MGSLTSAVAYGQCPGASPDPANISCQVVKTPCRNSQGETLQSLGAPPFGQTSTCAGNLFLPIPVAGLTFHYNSQDELPSHFGDRISFLSYLSFDNSSQTITFRRSDGRILAFSPTSDGRWLHPEWHRGELYYFSRADTGGFVLNSPDLTQGFFDLSFQNLLLPSKTIDANGLVTTLSYEQGKLVQIKQPAGQTWDFVYNGELLRNLYDPDRLKYTFEYVGTSLSKISLEGGDTQSFAYSSSPLPQHRSLLRAYGLRAERGSATWHSFSYYNQGVLQRISLAGGDSGIRFSYSGTGDEVLIEREIRSDGQWQRVSYRAESYIPNPRMGALLEEIREGNSKNPNDIGIVTARYEWHSDARLSKFRDAARTTAYGWGTSPIPVNLAHSDGTSMSFTRQDSWPYLPTVEKLIGPSGTHTTTVTHYNQFNLPRSIERFAGDVSSNPTFSKRITYNSSGRLPLRVETASSQTLAYTEAAYPWRLTNYSGPEGSYETRFDVYGVATQQSSALGSTTARYTIGYQPGQPLFTESIENRLGTMSYTLSGVDPAGPLSRRVNSTVSLTHSGLVATEEKELLRKGPYDLSYQSRNNSAKADNQTYTSPSTTAGARWYDRTRTDWQNSTLP